MINIERYNNSFSDEWEQIIQFSNNGTIFHKRKFLSYHPKDRFIDHSLVFYKNNKPFTLLPAAEINEVKRYWFHILALQWGLLLPHPIFLLMIPLN